MACCRAAILLLLFLLAGPAPGDAGTDELAALRADDFRLSSIAYRLGRAGIAACPDPHPMTGLVLHDLGQYASSRRAEVAAAFSLGRGIGVVAVVPGSPADRAGIAANDEIIAIGETSIVQSVPGPAVRPAFERLEHVLAILRDVRGTVRLGVQRGGQPFSVELAPEPGCTADVILLPSDELNAWADGTYVVVTSAMLAFVRSDDELAFVVAHELAHDILKHRGRLDAAGVPRGILRSLGVGAKAVRSTEDEADRFAIRLMVDAGYRPRAVLEFWDRFARRSGSGDPTHAPRESRIAPIRAEVESLEAIPALPGNIPGPK